MDQSILQRVGVKIGHHTDEKNLTGLTCFIAEKGANIGIDIRGSWAATLHTAAYDAKATSSLVYAIILAGGSLFGLESAFGVMQYLEEAGIGLQTRAGVMPEVTGAVIYDLAVGNGKVRPQKEDGYRAAKNATDTGTDQGNIGVGAGATIGKWFVGKPMKGGFGTATTTIGNDILVSAFVVTNAVGDIVNPKTNRFYSESGQQNLADINLDPTTSHLAGLIPLRPTNTTLAVIATNVSLQKTQLMKVAEQAHDGMARSIYPVHTSMDGDTVFAISSMSGEQKKLPKVSSATMVDLISLAAADSLAKAINSSIKHARSIEGFPAYKIS